MTSIIARFCTGILSLLFIAGAVWAAQASERRTVPMLEMTFPEFEAALARADTMLLPLGAIEEHGPYLPLGSDAFHAVGQLDAVASKLRDKGVETIVGPPLNIGLAYAAQPTVRPGANVYPGNLTVRSETFVALYVDVLRSLRENGIKRVFLYSGHFAGSQLEAMAQIAEQATRTIDGLNVYALIDSGQLTRLKLSSRVHVIAVENSMNREMFTQLLGSGAEPVTVTHADGWETSTMLYFRPDLVRPGFEKAPHSPSSAFIAATLISGDRTKNPNGTGGYPTDKASADMGRQIVEYRTARIVDAILGVLRPAEK